MTERLRFALLAFALACASCAPQGAQRSAGERTAGCDNDGLARARASAAAAAEVTVCGRVLRVLPARTTRSGPHQYFFVAAAGGPIEIVCNERDLGRIAVRPGDPVTVRGRYYHDPDGREGIDWTHAGVSRRWPYPGYVIVGARKYQ